MNLYDTPGFLGTRAHFLSDLTLIIILTSAGLFTFGVWLVLHKRYELHRWVQSFSVVINSSVVILVMIGSFWAYVLPAIPDKFREPSVWITIIHTIIGSIAVILGVFVVLRANNLVTQSLRFKNYKRMMRISYGFYMASTLIGVIVYVTTFMIGS
jgi:uncharacterized membrane protein YozB (DUF420 family)